MTAGHSGKNRRWPEKPGVRFLIDQFLECQGADRSALASLIWVGVDAAVLSGWPSACWRLQADKLMAGFFLCYSKPGVTRKGVNKVLKCTFLACCLTKALPLHFPTTLDIGCHLLQSGVPGLKDRQPPPRLLYIKQKGRRPIPLEKFLRSKRPTAARKKLFPRKLQLREPIQSFPVTRLVLPPLRALHRFYCLSYKLRHRPGLIVLPYLELEVTSHFSFLIHGFPEGVPNRFTLVLTKRKSYFQCFTFDFFSMVVMNPSLLLKQHHPKSLVSLGAL
ncbi:hypothetical protein Cgig2_002964 [Carnegiea gigantea]|uniref:Uncharacterized protein n=1 Tax=Carnegiea gigantea TaxID=171969 RepID=A0A9Q1JL64_9CARY|nr:hypothetical protein Cgig2_002964 [Carnegiea gigantea]